MIPIFSPSCWKQYWFSPPLAWIWQQLPQIHILPLCLRPTALQWLVGKKNNYEGRKRYLETTINIMISLSDKRLCQRQCERSPWNMLLSVCSLCFRVRATRLLNCPTWGQTGKTAKTIEKEKARVAMFCKQKSHALTNNLLSTPFMAQQLAIAYLSWCFVYFQEAVLQNVEHNVFRTTSFMWGLLADPRRWHSGQLQYAAVGQLLVVALRKNQHAIAHKNNSSLRPRRKETHTMSTWK